MQQHKVKEQDEGEGKEEGVVRVPGVPDLDLVVGARQQKGIIAGKGNCPDVRAMPRSLQCMQYADISIIQIPHLHGGAKY